jgi:hypothetical protein
MFVFQWGRSNLDSLVLVVHWWCINNIWSRSRCFSFFFFSRMKEVTHRWKFFIAYSVDRSLLLGGCRRSWMLWWKTIQSLGMNVGLLRKRFLARSTQALASATCIYFVVLRSGRGKVFQGAVTLRNLIETLLSEKFSHIWKVFELSVIIWDTLFFTYSTICRNNWIVFLFSRAWSWCFWANKEFDNFHRKAKILEGENKRK